MIALVTETAPVTAEVAFQALDLSFLEASAIGSLRKQHEQAMETAGAQAIQDITADDFFEHGLEARETARSTVSGTIDDQLDAYLKSHRFDQNINPEGYLYVYGVLKTVAAHRMDAEKWNLGDRDENGKHTRPETSGHFIVEQMLERLRGTTPDEIDDTANTPVVEAPTSETMERSARDLEYARNALALSSVQLRRKARKGGRKRERLATEYAAAQAAYEEARIAYGKLQAQGLRAQGHESNDLRIRVIHNVLDEHQNFTQAELNQLNEDPSRRARVSRFLARHHVLFFGGSTAAGFGIGYGIGKLTKGTAMSALGLGSAIALPAAIAGGIAIKTTKSVLQASVGNRVNQIRSQEKRANEDHSALNHDLSAELDADQTHDEMVTKAHNTFTKRVDNRVNKDIRGNKTRIIAAAAISGASGAAGFLLSSASDHSWPYAHGHHSASTSHPDNGASAKPNYDDTQPANRNNGHYNVSGNRHHDGGTHPSNVDGYNSHVKIERGNGYIKETQQLAAQKGVHLTDAQATDFYNHEVAQHGAHVKNALTNDHGYDRSNAPGDYGISRPTGNAHWASWWIHDLEDYEKAHDIKAAA